MLLAMKTRNVIGVFRSRRLLSQLNSRLLLVKYIVSCPVVLLLLVNQVRYFYEVDIVVDYQKNKYTWSFR